MIFNKSGSPSVCYTGGAFTAQENIIIDTWNGPNVFKLVDMLL